MENKNSFYAPFSKLALIKAEENGTNWEVYLEASNEHFDQEDDKTLCKALQDAADYYRTHGVISWDHKHKELNDPSFIIGEPTDVAFGNNKNTLIKGRLYKASKIAQSVMELIHSDSSRLGASVGGFIMQKSKAGTKNIISKVWWDETAITHKPVNDFTLGKVSVIPYQEFAKALMAGAGVNAADFSGGRAITNESIQGNPNDVFNELYDKIQNKEVTDYESVIQFFISRGLSDNAASKMASIMLAKLPDIMGKI